MPRTHTSGDPETQKIPPVIDDEKTTVRKTSPPPKTNQGKPKTEK
jgi:hypothetical protein